MPSVVPHETSDKHETQHLSQHLAARETMASAKPSAGPDKGTGDYYVTASAVAADGADESLSSAAGEHEDSTSAARRAAEQDKQLTFTEALRQYPKAVGWSLYFSLGVIMLAFDPQLLGNLYAVPAFQRDFGYPYNGSYIVSAPWQSALSLGNPIGQVLGALAAGIPMDRFGRRKTFAACVAMTGCCVFIQFFARSPGVLLAGELLGGLVLGAYVVIAPAYASEVAPLALRGVLTSYTNLCFVIGQLLANGVTAGTSKLDNHWAYSIPFALQWFWVALILPGLPFAPESPWWLVRIGRVADAENALHRLAGKGVDVPALLASIVETDALERDLQAGGSYAACLRPAHRRRTEIGVGVYAIQVLSGTYLVNYGTYFFERAGLPSEQAFNMGVGFLAVGLVGTLSSWALLQRVGRRTLYNYGVAVLAVLQLLIGILDCIPDLQQRTGIVWAQSGLMLAWNFAYDASIGPVCFVLLAECSAARLREKSIALATAVQAVLGIAMTVAIPYLINPDEADLRGKLGFVFGGLAALSLVWAWWRVPETKGRTYEELDVLFERGVPARRFKGYKFGDDRSR